MERHLTADEIEFNFQEWRAAYQRRMDQMHARLLAAFQRGETVTEVWCNGRRAEWRANTSANGARSCFLPEYNTPEYLAQHLANRHEHFGIVAEFENGESWEQGKLLDPETRVASALATYVRQEVR